MELLTWLRSLKADPTDPKSPPLFAVSGNLDSAAENYVKGSLYDRRPYVVVVGLPGNTVSRLHDETALLSSVVDIVILQSGASTRPSVSAVKAVWEFVKAAPSHVTSLPNYNLTRRLALVTIVEPQDRPDDSTGVYATLRYRASYAQPRVQLEPTNP